MRLPAQSTVAAEVTIPYGTCTITVKANGGTVDVDMLHDHATLTWVPATAQIIADGATALFPGPNARLKITPAGGAAYTVHGAGL